MIAPSRAGVVLSLVMVSATSAYAQGTSAFVGRRLVAVLQELQASGLRIVFSSAIVSEDLRVLAEPRTPTARSQLEELLAPHGLAIRDGPGGTLQIVPVTRSTRVRKASHGALQGQVLDAGTGAPLLRAQVRVEDHAQDARTDAMGHFEVSHVAKGTRVVTATAAGYQPARTAAVIDSGRTASITLRLFPDEQRHHEFVSVVDAEPSRTDRGVASEGRLAHDDFARAQGSVMEDPIRAVHVLPGVAATDDFRSEFAARGSPFRHVGLVVDGMSARWLSHSVFGSAASGSLMMLPGLVIERATLRSGAYARRQGDHLGSELDLAIREGSRRAFAMRGAIGGAHAVLAAEGPLGRRGTTGSARGSWLVSGRQSYLEWPPERTVTSRTPFGFSDALAKVVLEVTPTQQFVATAIRGVSTVDEDEDHFASGRLKVGNNVASALSLTWQSILGPAFVLRQQAALVTQRFSSSDEHGEASRAGDHGAMSYRVDLSRALAGGMLEAGGLVEQIHTTQDTPSIAGVDEASAWQQSGFAHWSWHLTRSLSLSPGLRVTRSTLTQPTVSRWLLGEWSFRRGWSMIGSAAAARQMPDLSYVLGATGSAPLRPERALHLDAGIEHRLTRDVRWRVTLFSRHEADVIRLPDRYPNHVVDAFTEPPLGAHYVNALAGTSRGIEVVVSRESARGVSGWATYAYGHTRHHDSARGESFPADFDQRHTLSAVARYRPTPSTSVAATMRAGSNFPIAGYFTTSNGRLFAGTIRNHVRLPTYARLDLRADHRLRSFGRWFTVFVEGLNVLNRTNVGLTDGSLDSATGEAIGFTAPLLRRRVSAGVVFEF
jgi:hypothetical protein